MHPYATDSDERRVIPVGLFVVALLLSYALHCAMRRVAPTMPWWVDVPSVGGFWALLYWSFDNYAWRWRILRRGHVVCIPDLNGTWGGHLRSSFDHHATKRAASLSIRQTWTRIALLLETDESQSQSLLAGILVRAPGDVTIMYMYENRPRGPTAETMHAHRGTAELELAPGELRGEYYAGRDRQNYGELVLRKPE